MEKGERFNRLELRLNPVLPAREIAIAWLNEAGFSMFEDLDEGLVAFAPESEYNETAMEHVMRQLSELASIEVKSTWVEAENWNAQWESTYEPIDVEGKLCMRAPFHAPPTTGLDIIIQPEMSFGTGHHPTTWQMMRGLLDVDCKGRSVLDVGCGTGVLAITAKKLGAARVVAFDIDVWSYENTLANVERNELTGEITVFQGTIAHPNLTGDSFDLVLANINRNVLIAEMNHYVRCLAPEGNILFSGFFTADIDTITSAAQRAGLSKLKETQREHWACLMFVKSRV